MTVAKKAVSLLVPLVRAVERGEITTEQCIESWCHSVATWRWRMPDRSILKRRWQKIFGPKMR